MPPASSIAHAPCVHARAILEPHHERTVARGRESSTAMLSQQPSSSLQSTMVGNKKRRRKRGQPPTVIQEGLPNKQPKKRKTRQASFRQTKQPPPLANDLSVVYGHGRLQRRALFFTMLSAFVFLVHSLLLNVIATNVDHWCKWPTEQANLTSEEWRNVSVPRDPGGHWLECVRYDPPLSVEATNRSQVPCEEWDYDLEGSSIITEWNLVCDRHWLLTLASVVYTSGAATAALIMGKQSDKRGRRPIIRASVVSLLASGMSICFASSVTQFLVFRFWVAASASTVFLTSFVLLFELSTPEYQCLYSVIAIGSGIIAVPLFLGILNLLTQEWVLTQAVVMLPTSLLLLSPFFLMVESPRWLLASLDWKDGELVLIRAAQINGCSIHDAQRRWRLHNTGIYAQARDAAAHGVSHPVDLVRSKVLRRRAVIVFWAWFFVMLAFYYAHSSRSGESVGLQTTQMALNVFGAVLLYFSTTRLGRGVTLLALLVAFSLLQGLNAFVRMFLPASVVASLVNRGASIVVNQIVIILYAYSVELFPTVVRSMGLYVAYFFGRLGSIASPLLREATGEAHETLILLLLSVLGIFTALTVHWLPETMSTRIINTLEDMEEAEQRNLPQRSHSTPTAPSLIETRMSIASVGRNKSGAVANPG